MLRQRATFAIAAGLLMGAAYPSLGQDRNVPDLIRSQHDPRIAVWVSADKALAVSGQLRSDQLGQLARMWEVRSANGSIAVEGCYDEGMVLVDPLPNMVPVSTLSQLSTFSVAVVSGTVAGTEPGFFQQRPGLLVRLEPIEVLAGGVTAPTGPLFVHYPNARFDVGSFSFCKSDPRLRHEPQVGDRFLVFIRTGVWGDERRLISPLPDDVFVETGDGELLSPGALRDDPVVAAAESIADIVGALALRVTDQGS